MPYALCLLLVSVNMLQSASIKLMARLDHRPADKVNPAKDLSRARHLEGGALARLRLGRPACLSGSNTLSDQPKNRCEIRIEPYII